MNHQTYKLQLDDYVDGLLDPRELAQLEAHLQGCDRCSAEVADLRAIVGDAADLGGLAPQRDLWSEIAPRLAGPRRRRRIPAVLTAATVAVGGGILAAAAAALFVVPALVTDAPSPGMTAAEAALREGDLPLAMAEYARLDPKRGAVGHAYLALLAGRYADADELLADAESGASGDELREVRLRRALVGLRAGDLDDVRDHGRRSEHPAGLLLAAEVHLRDGEQTDAIDLLRKVAAQSEPSSRRTAAEYLALVESDDPVERGLAEATAMWALGDRAGASEEAGLLVPALDGDTHDEQALVWAGRAATSGKPGVARMLLDEVVYPPPGQAWRVQATSAIISVAEGRAEDALMVFAILDEAGAPPNGIADARATAASLADSAELARRLVADSSTSAAARGLLAAGAPAAAAASVPPGTPFARYLAAQ